MSKVSFEEDGRAANFMEFLLAEKLVSEDELSILNNNIRTKGLHLFQALLNQNVDSMEKIDTILATTAKRWLKCEYFSTADELLAALDRPKGMERRTLFRTKVFHVKLDEASDDTKEVVDETDFKPFEKKVFPVKIEQGGDGAKSVVNLATFNPFDLELHDVLAYRFHGSTIKWHLAHPMAVERAARFMRTILTSQGDDTAMVIDFSRELEEILNVRVDKASVPEMINWFIYKAFESRASDIHIEPGEKSMAVRFRIDGVLVEESNLHSELHPEIVSRIKILSEMNVAEKRLPQDGRFMVKIKSTDIDLRVSTFPTVYGEKVVLRLLERTALQPSLEEIGFQKPDLSRFYRVMKKPHGMIIISGPTGSGKTTTLYSAINTIDVTKVNVVTVEDPVEYRLAGVHQLQVKEKIGLTFASSLKTILRQDPDVILLGEIRDTETAQIAVRAAMTGHIVLSTLHTNGAVGVIMRLLDMGIEPFLLSSALSLCMAQRLVRKICEHCREIITGMDVLVKLLEMGIAKDTLDELGIHVDTGGGKYEWGRGCNVCRGTGYYGRKAVMELFEVNDEIRQVISTSPLDEQKLNNLVRHNGMSSLMEHGKALVDEGVTTVEELVRVLGEN